jgi:ligand-binding SRPBCC domain-containing protein
MAHVREEVAIAAPPEFVWDTVHENPRSLPRWAGFVRRSEALDGRLGRGARLRYELELPGGIQASQVLRPSVWDRPHRCAGRFLEGPLQGTWSYRYEERDGTTHLVYEMDYRMGGLMRLAGGRLVRQLDDSIREAISSLKDYVESERSRPPRQAPRPPARLRPPAPVDRADSS